MPAPPPAPLPASDAPSAPAWFREVLGAVEANLTSRCGRVTVRLGEDLRRQRLEPGGDAVLLLEVEPLRDQVKIRGLSLQSHGTTRPSLISCAQLYLKGLALPASRLLPGERLQIQVVLGQPAG